jgi:excisionase family DNA binding protein
MSDRTAVFLRLTAEQATRLDQASVALKAHKKDLVGALVDRFIDPADIEKLREWTRPVTVDVGSPAPVVGHAEFTPAEVLDVAGAADLLRVDEAAIVDLATKGELPGRRIGDQWRFSRAALLSWLG